MIQANKEIAVGAPTRRNALHRIAYCCCWIEFCFGCAIHCSTYPVKELAAPVLIAALAGRGNPCRAAPVVIPATAEAATAADSESLSKKFRRELTELSLLLLLLTLPSARCSRSRVRVAIVVAADDCGDAVVGRGGEKATDGSTSVVVDAAAIAATTEVVFIVFAKVRREKVCRW